MNGERSISAQMAIRLGQAFGTTPQYWMNLQAIYDLKRARAEIPPKCFASHHTPWPEQQFTEPGATPTNNTTNAFGAQFTAPRFDTRHASCDPPCHPPHPENRMPHCIAAVHADPDQPAATFAAIDAALAEAPGHILFTILVHHPALKQSERFYSNLPHAYPIGGRKPVTNSPWMQRVIFGGEPYIGHTREDIAEHFFDHELIHSLGCDSILNMPVRWRGETLGTLNLCHRAGFYDESHLPGVKLIAQLALPALLLISRT